MTYTVAEMEVSFTTFVEILKKLDEAGYDHAIGHDSEGFPVSLDMTHIALLCETPITEQTLVDTVAKDTQRMRSLNSVRQTVLRSQDAVTYVSLRLTR